jgi:hypothetical protein
VKNEHVFLPIWLKYYSKYFNAEDIYVIDHDSDDGSLEECLKRYKFNVIKVHHEFYSDIWKCKTTYQKQAELLQRYEYVLFTDADEIVIPNPSKYRDLKDYITRHDSDCVASSAYELIHLRERESPIDLSRPILEQRKYWYFNSFYNKSPLLRIPLERVYEKGAENCGYSRDNDLWLFHLHKLDFDLCWDKHVKLAAQRWSPEDIKKGFSFQWRINDPEEFARFFYTRHPDYAKLWTSKRQLVRPLLSFIKKYLAAVGKGQPVPSWREFIMKHPLIKKIPLTLRKRKVV